MKITPLSQYVLISTGSLLVLLFISLPFIFSLFLCCYSVTLHILGPLYQSCPIVLTPLPIGSKFVPLGSHRQNNKDHFRMEVVFIVLVSDLRHLQVDVMIVDIFHFYKLKQLSGSRTLSIRHYLVLKVTKNKVKSINFYIW